MGIQMPLFERFAKGTRWKLACPFGALPAGTIVEIVKEPYEAPDPMMVDIVPAVDSSLYGEYTLPLDLLT